jgi:hypothetical protein
MTAYFSALSKSSFIFIPPVAIQAQYGKSFVKEPITENERFRWESVPEPVL